MIIGNKKIICEDKNNNYELNGYKKKQKAQELNCDDNMVSNIKISNNITTPENIKAIQKQANKNK